MEEKDWLVRRLGSLREALLWKLEGLSEADARRPRTPTGTNLAGLVKHCAAVEQSYLAAVLGLAGVPHRWPDDDAGPNAELFLTEQERVGDVVELYRRVAEHSDGAIREVALDSTATVPWWSDDPVTVREIVVHVIAEVARHAGHADILREQIDGSAGLVAHRDNLEVPPHGWAAHVRRLDEIAGAFADETDVYADD